MDKTNYEQAQEALNQTPYEQRAQVYATLAICDHLHQITEYLDKIYEANSDRAIVVRSYHD